MKIMVYAYTNKLGSKVEKIFDNIDEEEWAEASEQQNNEMMLEMLLQSGIVEWGYEVVE